MPASCHGGIQNGDEEERIEALDRAASEQAVAKIGGAAVKSRYGTIGRLAQLNGSKHSYFCGSYFGHGLHEDAVTSAIAVAGRLGVRFRPKRPTERLLSGIRSVRDQAIQVFQRLQAAAL